MSALARRAYRRGVIDDDVPSAGIQTCEDGPVERVCRRALGLDQRRVAIEDQRDALVGQHGHGLLHGVAGAQLRLLAHKIQIEIGCSPRGI